MSDLVHGTEVTKTCPSCGKAITWCNRCQGYHHSDVKLWEQNHRHWCIIDMKTGEPIFQSEKMMKWEHERQLEAARALTGGDS